MGSNLQSGDGDDEAVAQLQAWDGAQRAAAEWKGGRQGAVGLGVWAVRTQAGTCLLHDVPESAGRGPFLTSSLSPYCRVFPKTYLYGYSLVLEINK